MILLHRGALFGATPSFFTAETTALYDHLAAAKQRRSSPACAVVGYIFTERVRNSWFSSSGFFVSKHAGPCTVFFFFARPLSSPEPTPVKAGAKERDDEDDAVGKLPLCGFSVVCFHDDFCSVLFKKTVEEIIGETADPVSMGNAHDS